MCLCRWLLVSATVFRRGRGLVEAYTGRGRGCLRRVAHRLHFARMRCLATVTSVVPFVGRCGLRTCIFYRLVGHPVVWVSNPVVCIELVIVVLIRNQGVILCAWIGWLRYWTWSCLTCRHIHRYQRK